MIKRGLFVFAILLGVLFSFCFSGGFVSSYAYNASNGTTEIWECGTIVTNGTYILNQSFSNFTSSFNCIEIQAHNVLLDGKGFNISNNDSSLTYGIYNNNYDNLTIKNITISDFTIGIYLGSNTNVTLQNNTISSNEDGIQLISSNNNTIINNTLLYNTNYGIYLQMVSGNLIQNNTIQESNVSEIYIYVSSNNHCNNFIQNNTGSGGREIKYYNDTIILGDEILSELILCNADNSSLNNVTIKGSSILKNNGFLIFLTENSNFTNINSTHNYNGFEFISSSNNTLLNCTVNLNIAYGISLSSSDNNTLTNNTVTSNGLDGIIVGSSDGNNLTNNTVEKNYNGIFFTGGDNNILLDNLIKFNTWGVYFSNPSNNNTLTNNSIYGNSNAIYDINNNVYNSNELFYNLDYTSNKTMIGLIEIDRNKSLSDLISFNLSMYYPNATICSSCTYNVSVYPDESYALSKSSNYVFGNFTVTKQGIYSLFFNITDENNNTAKSKFIFLVDATGNSKVTYYFRDIDPIHGQPGDGKGVTGPAASLSSIIPVNEEEWFCTSEIMNYPVELLAKSPINIVNNIYIYNWYKMITPGYIGIQRFINGMNNIVDKNETLSASVFYNWTNINFTNLNWSMDYSYSFYYLALKLQGGSPYWMTNATNPSYVEFNYTYTITPWIKSISNEDVILLSAISTTGLENSTIYLDGDGSTDLSLEMPNTGTYTVYYDDILCNNSNCNYTQSGTEFNFTLILGSVHKLEITSPSTPSSCTPTTEICDKLDNDCDGLIDEDDVCGGGGSSGGGGTITEPENISSFSVEPHLLNLTIVPGNNKTSEINLINEGNTDLTLLLSLQGINEFSWLSKYFIELKTGESKKVDINFNIGENIDWGVYQGNLIIRDEHNSANVEIFVNVIEKEFNEVVSSVFTSLGNSIKETVNDFQDLSTGEKVVATVVFVSFWGFLFVLFLVYATIKQYVKFRDRIAGYKSREDKIAEIDRLERKRLGNNFFGKLVDKTALSLTKNSLS